MEEAGRLVGKGFGSFGTWAGYGPDLHLQLGIAVRAALPSVLSREWNYVAFATGAGRSSTRSRRKIPTEAYRGRRLAIARIGREEIDVEAHAMLSLALLINDPGVANPVVYRAFFGICAGHDATSQHEDHVQIGDAAGDDIPHEKAAK